MYARTHVPCKSICIHKANNPAVPLSKLTSLATQFVIQDNLVVTTEQVFGCAESADIHTHSSNSLASIRCQTVTICRSLCKNLGLSNDQFQTLSCQY